MTSLYTPTIVPSDLDDPQKLQAFFERELKNIATGMDRANTLSLDPQFVLPTKPEEGQIFYADGVSWNPGSGEGYYGYTNGAWVFLSTTLTSLGVSTFIQTLLNDADAVVARTTLGVPWEEIVPLTTFSGQTVLDFINLSTYRELWLRLYCTTNTDSNNVYILTSTNNGSSYDNAAANYLYHFLRFASATVAGGAVSTTGFFLCNSVTLGNAADEQLVHEVRLTNFNQATRGIIRADGFYQDTAGTFNDMKIDGWRVTNTARNAFRVGISAGTFTGVYQLMGVRG